jgi:hypothetical protein
MCITLKLGHDPIIMFLISFSCFAEYYLANWIAYVKGKYYFGLIDCNEGEIGMCLLHLSTSVFGDFIWEITVKYKKKFYIK